MTARQIQLIHIAKSQLKLTDAAYRTILRSVAGAESSKDLSQSEFEDAMSVLEAQGFRDAEHHETYWRDKVASRGRYASSRQVFIIQELAEKQRYELDALAYRFSNHRTYEVSKLTPAEAWCLTEMLKKVIERENNLPPLPSASNLVAQGQLYLDLPPIPIPNRKATVVNAFPHQARPTEIHVPVTDDEIPF